MKHRVASVVAVRLLVALLVLGCFSDRLGGFGATVVAQENKGNPNAKVWVNTASGVYHCPGTRYYGATKRGAYMTQAAAQKANHRPAYGRVCE